jgi:hypothetical protein
MESKSTEFECDLGLGDVVISELEGVTVGYPSASLRVSIVFGEAR